MTIQKLPTETEADEAIDFHRRPKDVEGLRYKHREVKRLAFSLLDRMTGDWEDWK